jgi:beta-lactamase regulating signal transducer with metallopeptidase domain
MNAFSIPGAPAWFNMLLNLSFQAALLAAIIWVVIKVFGRWIPPNWRALMWSLVILRSLIPFAPPSPFSVQNLFSKPSQPSAIQIIVERPAPTIQFVQPVGSNILYNPISHTLPIEHAKAEVSPQPNGRPLTLGWGIGAIFFGGLLLARTLIIRRALLRTGVEPPLAILNILASCREAFGARYPLRVTASDQIASPALTGFLPARLIIPTTFTTERYTSSQIRHILLHELAHIQQGHLVLHWLALLGRVVHRFNPAIHFAAAQMRQECELAADTAALKNSTPEERAAYGETILQVLSHSTAPPTLLALGMAEHARHLKQRLSALANPHQRHFRSLGLAFIAVLTLTGLTSEVEGQDPAPAISEAEFEKLRGETTTRYSVGDKNAVSSDTLEHSPDERAQEVRKRRKELEELANNTPELIAENSRTIVGGAPTQGQIEQLNNQGPQGMKAAATLESSWNRPVGRGELPTPNPYARTNTVNTSPSRQKLYRKLETIRIGEFPLPEETTLPEVLKRLGDQVKRIDPSGRGINLIISKTAGEKANAGAIIDPITGVPAEPQKAHVDPEDFKIKFDPPIHDVTLGQFLDAIVMVAQLPQPPPSTAGLRYSVEDYAIVFSVMVAEPEKFYSRTFRLNPNTFRQAFEGVYATNPFQGLATNRGVPNAGGVFRSGGDSQRRGPGVSFVTTLTNSSSLQKDLRAFFAAAGVDFSADNIAAGSGAVPAEFGVAKPGEPQTKAMFLNERTGMLMVRATLRDLDIIENAVHVLNTPTAQTAADATNQKQSVPRGVKSPEDLVTQSFKLDPNAFKQRLEAVLPRISGTTIHDIPAQIRAFADMAGVKFPASSSSSGGTSQKSIFYNEATGHLFARATPQELVLLGRAIANPNLVPPRVSIVVRAYELPAEEVARIKTNFVADRGITATNEFVIGSTNVLANPPASLLEQTKQIVESMKNVVIASNFAPASQFIMARPALNTLIKQLDGAKGVDLMTMPNVTTLIGRQARISVEETHTIVTPNGTNFNQVQIPFGWAFDCFPESFDGTDLQIRMAAAQTKFLGYDSATTPQLARLHVEATGARARLPLGSSQAFLMPIPNHKDLPILGDLPYLGRLFRAEQEPRHILILITPVIVDSVGNPVYPQSE